MSSSMQQQQSQQSVAMDVDSPSGGGGGQPSGGGTLKRCSSAPMINDATNAVMSTSNGNTNNREQQPYGSLFGTPHTRTRRFSASFSPVPGSPISGPRLTPRINQLRQEEHEVISNTRELAHEREIHHAMQISQSWEDLSLMNDNSSNSSCDWKPLNKTTPLQISLPTSYGNAFMCNSPSPTRTGFQSPTRSRTIIRRSASPVLRPSPLGVKRKLDEDPFCAGPRAKRVYSYSGTSLSSSDRGLGGLGGLLTTTTGGSASSSSSLGAPPLPPGSLSSAGTPESVSSAGGESPRAFVRSGTSHQTTGGGTSSSSTDTPSPVGGGHHMHHHYHQLHKDDHEMADSLA